jgi:hypothetical protein
MHFLFRMKVVFLPEYNVSLAECLIPASDVCKQISAGASQRNQQYEVHDERRSHSRHT